MKILQRTLKKQAKWYNQLDKGGKVGIMRTVLKFVAIVKHDRILLYKSMLRQEMSGTITELTLDYRQYKIKSVRQDKARKEYPRAGEELSHRENCTS